MKKLSVLSSIFLLLLLTSCNKEKIKTLESQLELKKQEVALLQGQIANLETTNGGLLDRMADLSIISKTGAESINESLRSLSQQYGFIQNLTTKMQSKDSLNLALVMNLKRSLIDINDEDVFVEVRGGLVHVSISDKLLFQSGSSKINTRAQEVLGKIAAVINDHNDLDVVVEGHTDDVPITNSCVADNWDLSVKRATAVVRYLEKSHYVDPARMTAAGRSEYAPKADNTTSEGRSLNRRTEIVITPKLDQFFKLLEAPKVSG
jgi:chemotaxis protein MotB